MLQDKVVGMMPDEVKAQRPSWNSPEVPPAESSADGSAAAAQEPAYKSRVPPKTVDSTAAVIARMEASLAQRQRELQEQAQRERV